MLLRCLEKPDYVAVRVFDGGDQLPSSDVPYRLLRFSASVEEILQALLDVVYVPVVQGAGHSLAVAVGIEADVLSFDLEADVLGLVHVGLGVQELAVQLLRPGKIRYGVDDGLDAFGHGWLLSVVTLRRLGSSLLQ